MLNHGADDPSRFLKKFLVAPVGIERGQFSGYPVVQSQEDHVQGREGRLLAETSVAGSEASC